jgi:hypothetical protein
MNPLKKGPEIKLPDSLRDLRVPGFVEDVYADLRDRHLLPFVIVLLVAIVAVPILLSKSGGEGEPVAGSAATAETGKGAPAQQIVVSRSTPRLRDYHRRLEHLAAEDPFVQRFTGEKSEEGSGGSSGSSSGGSSGEGGEITITHEEGETTTTTTHHELRYFTWTMDVKIAPVSSKGVPSKAKPTVRHDLPELTELPSRQVPALVFMQPAADGKKAIVLINSNVRAVFGEGVCVAGGEVCQLMALKPGMPETIVYGGSERVYRITLLGVHLEETDQLRKAPLGHKPKQSGRPQTMATAPVGAAGGPQPR